MGWVDKELIGNAKTISGLKPEDFKCVLCGSKDIRSHLNGRIFFCLSCVQEYFPMLLADAVTEAWKKRPAKGRRQEIRKTLKDFENKYWYAVASGLHSTLEYNEKINRNPEDIL